MKLIEKTKAQLCSMRDATDEALSNQAAMKALEARSPGTILTNRRNSRALMEAVLLIDLVKAFVAGDQRITREHLVNFLNKETMK